MRTVVTESYQSACSCFKRTVSLRFMHQLWDIFKSKCLFKTVSVGFSVLYDRESSLELSCFTEEFSSISSSLRTVFMNRVPVRYSNLGPKQAGALMCLMLTLTYFYYEGDNTESGSPLSRYLLLLRVDNTDSGSPLSQLFLLWLRF